MVGASVTVLIAALLSAACARAWLLRQVGPSIPSPLRLLIGALGVGLLVLGARLYLSEGRVSWAPYLDQIASDFTGLLVPMAHGTVSWRDLVAANNEHRVILTRLATLAEVLMNGSWDNRVLVVALFLLQAATAAWIFTVSWVFLGRLRGGLVSLATLTPLFLVCDWENMVSGFQNQFLFMVLGSLVAFSLIDGRAGTRPHRAGALLLALLTLGAMASGLLTAVALAATVLFVSLVSRRGWRAEIPFILGAAAVAGLGWVTRHQTPHTPDLYAVDLPTWGSAFLAYGSWPLMPSLLGFAILWAPSAALLVRTLRRREVPPFASFALALACWVLLQAAALAWSRAGLRGLVSARYTEVLALAFVANTAAAVLLLPAAPSRRPARWIAWGCLALWVTGIGAAEIWRSNAIYRPYLDGFRSQTIEHEQRLGSFMRTGNRDLIEGVAFPHVPGGAAEIIGSLADPRVQPLLPGPLRRDLARDREPDRLPEIKDGPLAAVALLLWRNRVGIAATGLLLLLGAIGYPNARPIRSGTPKPE